MVVTDIRSRSPVRDRGAARRNARGAARFARGPAHEALGAATEVVDCHVSVMPPFDAANGVLTGEKLSRLQADLGTHYAFTLRTDLEPSCYSADGATLFDVERGMSKEGVTWSRDALGRPAWEPAGGGRFVKGHCPAHVAVQANAYSEDQLIASMDFADVAVGVLQHNPALGDLTSLHREAFRRYPLRFRRLITIPDLNSILVNMDAAIAYIDEELSFGGVVGFQFFTGWFQGDWDAPEMKPFWDHLVSRHLAVWFTCVQGHPKRYTPEAEELFKADYDKLLTWANRYESTDVVLTHGLPWRSYIHPDRRGIGPLPKWIFKIFDCPRIYLQLVVPSCVGDVFDFPYKEVNPMIERLYKKIGAKRLLFGSDMPMAERSCTYAQSIRHIAQYCEFMTIEDRAFVLGGNARRLFKKADAAPRAMSNSALSFSNASIVSDVAVMVRLPASIGQRLETLETPCLLVDLDAFDSNCRTMSDLLRPLAGKKSISLRPHTKAHKCSALALRQLAAHGDLARGVCCHTVREAEAMARGGVLDVFLTNIVADPQKIARLLALALQGAKVTVCIDSLEGVELWRAPLSSSAAGANRIGVMIEIAVGCRTGVDVADTSATVEIAEAVASIDGLWLRGLQAYSGTAQHLRKAVERNAAIVSAADAAKRHLAALKEATEAVPVETLTAELIISGGGTGTVPLEIAQGYSELQCGSYVFHDSDYALNQDRQNWQQSLFVLGSVIGAYKRSSAKQATTCTTYIADIGLKSVAFDSGVPTVQSPGGSTLAYINLGDEHGSLHFEDVASDEKLAVGTRLLFTPGHCDPTASLYDHIVGVRKGVVEAVFRVDGRGY